MTSITEEIRSTGIPFSLALEKLKVFIGDEQDVWCMGVDWFVLEGNLKAHSTPNPFTKPFKRLKPLLPDYGITVDSFKKVGLGELQSGGLHKVLNIELPSITGIGAHDAEHDARSLIYSIHHLGVK